MAGIVIREATIRGVNLIPWQVANVTAIKNVSNDWIIKWGERLQYSEGMQDYADIEHDIDWAGYTIAILDGPGGSVVRTKHITVEAFTYTEALQIEDFSIAISIVTFKIFGM